MGVPDENEGPVRKRPRLSLRTSHKPNQNKNCSEAANVEMVAENTTDANQNSSSLVKILDSECIDAMADLPLSPDPVVAPVASLHNLGNTCFLNSVLEVLRYTPGFLNGITKLHDEILAQESRPTYQETSGADSSDVKLNQQIIKSTYTLYTEMTKKEEQYTKIATADATSMAVRPTVLLDTIRELNPMFEGHFQHDAQELLRCLLCYVEDAEKELLRWKESEDTNLEKNQAVVDIEAKRMGHSTTIIDKIKVELTETGATSNNWDSLKGGECRDRSKKTSHGRVRSNNSSLISQVKNTKNHEETSTESFSNILDKAKSDNKKSIFDGFEGHGQVNSSIHSLSTATKKVKEEVETVSHLPYSKTRKRLRSTSASCNKLAGVEDHVESTRSYKLRKKLFHTNTSSNSVIVGMDQKGENKNSNRSLHEPSSLSVVNIPVDNEQVSIGSSSESSTFHNTLVCSQDFNTSSKSSIQQLSTVNSSKFSIPSVLPFGQTKRLGMRGRALCYSDNRNSQNIPDIDHTLVFEDVGGNNSGDVNNNSDSFANNNNNDDNNNSCNSRFVNVSDEGTVHRTFLKISEKNYEEMPECKNLHITASCDDSSESPVVISSPSETSTKSPIIAEHSNEIIVIPENDVPNADFTIDSVTRKYFSALSQADSTLQISSSSSIFPSCVSHAGYNSFAEPPTEILSNEATNATTSHLHVLEPNNGINVTVLKSPKKQSVPSVFSNELFGSADSKLSCDRLQFSSGDASHSRLQRKGCNRSASFSTEGDSVSLSSLSLSDKFLYGSQIHIPETIQGLTPPCKSDTSSCNTVLHKSSISTRSGSSAQTKLSILEQAAGQRSPGANITSKFTYSLKLDLKKCDWLGVSPVKSINARKAMLALDQDKRALKNNVRRMLCMDSDSNSFISSSNDDCHTKSDSLHPLSSQNYLKEDTYHLLSECSNSNERKYVMEALATPHTEDTDNETKLINPQGSILNFTRRSPRISRKVLKSCDHFSDSSDKMKSKQISFSPAKINSLQSLSITLENCDWLIKAAGGKPISAKQAIMNINNGSKIMLKSQSITGTESFEKQSKIKNTELSLTDVKLQTSPTTLIEKLFGGTMMHQTKCLECEIARQRQEIFLDISVPVRSLHSGNNGDDDSSDDDDDSERTQDKSGDLCLSKLIQAFSNVERLMGANKYFCEQCVHHVEAERSCHYLTLPTVLTLHLKRFSANSRSFGGVTKLVDKVIIPQNLPCLRYQCIKHCLDVNHKYSLFAIITHSGTSILHGHYRSYVKVQPQVNPSVFYNLMRSKVKAYGTQNQTSKANISYSPLGDLTNSQYCSGDIDDACKTAKTSDLFTNDGECNVSNNVLKRNSISTCYEKSNGDMKSELYITQSDVDKTSHVSCADETKPEVGRSENGDDDDDSNFWLEFDDECVKVMDKHEFVEKLEERDGHLIGTPYVLFYHKLQT